MKREKRLASPRRKHASKMLAKMRNNTSAANQMIAPSYDGQRDEADGNRGAPDEISLGVGHFLWVCASSRFT